MAIREIPKRKGSLGILFSVLLGLLLARLVMISPSVAIIVLSSGVVLALTIFLRKTDYIIVAWVILTTFVWIIMIRLLPHYYSIVGRGIFWGLLACVIVAWAVDNILSGKQFIPFDNVALKATVIIFVLWGTITVYTSQEVFLSVKKLSHIVIGLVASYMFYDFFSRDQNNIKKLLKIVSLIAIFVSFITVATAINSFISGVPIYKRLSLWFWNPNTLGIFLFMCMPMSVTAGLYFVSNKRIRTLLIAIMLLALYLSFHRTSWLAALVALVFILARTGEIKTPIKFAIVACLFLAGFILPFRGGDVFDYVTQQQYTGRTEIWKASMKVATDHPVLGTGPGTSVANISEHIDTTWLRNQDTHSVYLKNAVEMGWPSVVIMLAFYAMFFYFSIRIEKNLKSHYLKLVTRGAMATMLGVMFHGIFECGFLMTAFDAAEFTVMWPYIVLVLPFAAKKLEERGEVGAK